ncbi:MAG: YczE/YyaS/YitT family protein [Candidatus Izemoplasmataceae bacterium]
MNMIKSKPWIISVVLGALVLVLSLTSLGQNLVEQCVQYVGSLIKPPVIFQDVFMLLALTMLLIVGILKIVYRKKDIFSLKQDVLYIVGFFFLGLGANLALRSTVGAGPWDTVTYSLRALLENRLGMVVTLGNASFIINMTVMSIVILYRRKIKYLFMLIPLFLISLSIDFSDLILLGDYYPTMWLTKGLFFVFGLIAIPFGIAMIIFSKYTAFVFDELMLMFMDIFHTKKMSYIRISNEVFALLLAIFFGVLAGIGIGQVNIGSFFIALSVGPLIELFSRLLKYIEQNPDTVRRNLRYTGFYLLGSIAIAFGVVMILRSNIGLSSWDTLHYSLHKLLGITVGTATILVASSVTLFIVIIKKEYHYFFMAVPIILVGGMIDLFNEIIFVDFSVVTWVNRVLIYALGLFLLPMGGALLIISTYPAGVFDELMLLIMKLSNSNKMTKIRVIMELSAVTLAIVLGFIAGIGFGMVNIGTLIFSLSVGVLIKLYLKLFERIGLYELK